MEVLGLLCEVQIEWNKEFFGVGSWSKSTGCLQSRILVDRNKLAFILGTVGMEQGSLQGGYRLNGPGRPSVLGNARMEHGVFQFAVLGEWNLEGFSLCYGSNGIGKSSECGTGGI